MQIRAVHFTVSRNVNHYESTCGSDLVLSLLLASITYRVVRLLVGNDDRKVNSCY